MSGSPSPREHLAVLTSFAPRIGRVAWTGGVGFGVGLIATTVLVLSTSRLYRSEAVVVYERGVQASATEGDAARSMATRLRDMLSSRQRLEGMIKEMKIYRRIVDKHGLGEAIDEMRKHLNVSGHEGYTYRVSYDGESRDLAKDVLDKLLTGAVEEDKQRRARDVDETKRFLDTERKRADEDLKGKESTLAEFLTKHPQFAGEIGGGGASAGGLIRAADRDRASVTGGDSAALELQAAQLEESLAAAGVRPSAPMEAPLDPQLLAARTRLEVEAETARRDLAEKETHLTNEHPDVKQAIRRLAVAEAASKRAEQALAASRTAPPADSSATGGGAENARVEALRRALGAVRQQIASMRTRSAPRVEVPKAASSVVQIDTEWTRINREVSEARERQSQLEGKQFQAELAATLTAGGLGGQLVIADPPFRPNRPVTGERSKIALVGLAGSLALALLVTGLFALFDDRLYALRDVDGILDDGIVVIIPSAPRRLPARGETAGREATGGGGATSADKGAGSSGG